MFTGNMKLNFLDLVIRTNSYYQSFCNERNLSPLIPHKYGFIGLGYRNSQYELQLFATK